MSVFIPAQVRGIVYSVYAFLGLALGATQVGFASANAGQPTWLTVGLAVFAFVGTGIGYTAASNTPAAPSNLVDDSAFPPVPDPAEVEGVGESSIGDGLGDAVQSVSDSVYASDTKTDAAGRQD